MTEEVRKISDSSNAHEVTDPSFLHMKQYRRTTNNISIYRHESQTSQLFPAKSHNSFQSSQGTLKVMKH